MVGQLVREVPMTTIKSVDCDRTLPKRASARSAAIACHHAVRGAFGCSAHHSISAPQTRLDVRDAWSTAVFVQHLGCCERARDRGIDVADHDDEVRFSACQFGLEACQNFRGLDSVRTGPHAEINVRLGQSEIAKETPRHLVVIVLPGVHKGHSEARMPP